MPDRRSKSPKNVRGRFYVDCDCLDHSLCHEIAPNNFARDDALGSYYVCKQPETPEETAQCQEAVESCPVKAIGDDGDQTQSISTRLSLPRLATGITCLVIVHVAVVFFLYSRRTFVHALAVPSEFVVFFFPGVVAFIGYYFLLRARAVRMIPPSVGAFLLTLHSFSLSLLLSFNVYGT